MNSRRIEIVVGLFVVAGILSLGWLSFKLGKKELLGTDHYSVFADFETVSGLRQNGEIEIAGVVIGNIGNIGLHKGMARVELKIRNDITLPEDTIVSVKTRGLIGDKILSLSMGGSEETVPPGGVLFETEPALDLESLISKAVFGDV
ncbi:ABC transporter, periplasmic binding component, putative ATP-dependent toluene efflux transporter [Nitrospina gracilis 3/211]|uniref:ABC transporter, periplasmic binding component, putative ATP-dependent toluene efflux transporter n=1 Tax=Nitrospina gracilis (strain 3/211) TaxID=1266370 RepID=M1YZG3_NITG3|nr:MULTISPECIES: outer membrane lipid asymmetry maintenance protein MlaD [Nitrospina]MCF8723562.1 phospholipid/cholesterol/gamma-HCH transport system substrate-binding protein [Nitrospina sp. Nb-3]CCQ90635.1 ABC transporter, periplasmic binding component, putative ATP-dependent toluene efflux transporter [Nitrospina gracilis 3/211]